jgi:hypothetical protein
MSPTTPLKWRRAFLRALAATANVGLSAQFAGIDKTTAYAARKRSTLFAALWDRALADGHAAVASGAIPDDAARISSRPLSIRSSRTGQTCVMETGEGRWNAEVEAKFIAVLATTANVAAAAKAIGMSKTALYRRRKQWPAFHAAWAEAVALAVDKLDLHLIEAATNLFDPAEVPQDMDIVPVSVDQVIKIVGLHRAEAKGGRRQRHDWRARAPDTDDIKAEIKRKLALLSRRHGYG